MIKLLLLGFLLSSFFTPTYATPAKVSVIFLFPDHSALNFINPPTFSWGPLLSFKDLADDPSFICTPREHGCFHPQYGIIPYEDLKGRFSAPNKQHESKRETEDLYLPGFGRESMNAGNMNLVHCGDPENYFNLYCGGPAEEEIQKSSGIHVWIDISTSMRQVDYSRDPKFCQRRIFAQAIQRDCPGEVHFSLFNTSLIPIQGLDRMCSFAGDNNTERIIEWIKRHSMDHLIIVTDVDEINARFMSYLKSIDAQIYGADSEKFIARNLLDNITKIAPECTKR